MSRSFSYWLVEGQNWRWILFIAMAIFILPLMIYQFLTLDSDLSNTDRRDDIAISLETELKNISLPAKTAIISTRYRTELSTDEFRNALNSELQNKRWIYYATENETGFISHKYCRGKYDADLLLERGQGIWADGGVYWVIEFSLGLRPMFGNGNLPPSCRGD